MMKKRIGDLFESRKGRMDYLLHRDFIDNGIVTFPCKIANVTVFDRDFMHDDFDQIEKANCLATIVDGEVVYKA